MKAILRYRQAIFLALIFAMADSLVNGFVFNSLANMCADYRHQLQDVSNQTNPPASNLESTQPNDVTIEGSNGTKLMFVYSSINLHFQIDVSGEYFDYSAYVEHVIRWTMFEKTFDFIRDVNIDIFETTFCILLIFGISNWHKPISRKLPIEK
jgi:hypothetical protein